MNTSLSPGERDNLLLAQMTMEEKVGLLHERSSTEGSSARLGIPLPSGSSIPPVQITPLPEQEHGQVVRTIASQGIVLLKNADELLPLSSQRSIAVIGADANNYITGGGSSFVKPTYIVGIAEKL